MSVCRGGPLNRSWLGERPLAHLVGNIVSVVYCEYALVIVNPLSTLLILRHLDWRFVLHDRRLEDPNFKIQEKEVEYVRALNVAPLKVVFAGPVDEVSSVIEDVFDIVESNVEGMQVRDKFAEFFEDKGSVEKVLSAIKLPKGGNSHSAYSLYHLKDKVNFEGVGNVTPWEAEFRRRKRVKCYVQGSGKGKRLLVGASEGGS
ncbi:hypothetical protein Tco_1420315 [Tanacetum coccineum]